MIQLFSVGSYRESTKKKRTIQSFKNIYKKKLISKNGTQIELHPFKWRIGLSIIIDCATTTDYNYHDDVFNRSIYSEFKIPVL